MRIGPPMYFGGTSGGREDSSCSCERRSIQLAQRGWLEVDRRTPLGLGWPLS